jgi:hypothetical protein
MCFSQNAEKHHGQRPVPIWDLMMKNVYAVGTANVDPQEFRFDIFYEDPGKGQKRFLDGPLPTDSCAHESRFAPGFWTSTTSTCRATPVPMVFLTLCRA